MRDRDIVSIIQSEQFVSPEDTIGRAAEVARLSGNKEIPVVRGSSVVGVVTEGAILNALLDGDPAEVSERPVSTIASDHVVTVNRFMSIGQVAEVMRDHGLQAVPVLDEFGRYMGVATRSDVTSALRLAIRPRLVGGLATPLGVYLTTGHIRAGASDLGLFLTGVVMTLMLYVSIGAVYALAFLVDKTGLLGPWSLWAILHSVPIGQPNWMDFVRSALFFASVLIFLLMLKYLPLSGYHGAEHQVVHAIENGIPLKPEYVSAMPRVHPRCGTNIVAAVALFMMVAETFSNEVAAFTAVFVLVFAWKVIGGYFQYYVTTRTPNAAQLGSGIRAGESLLEKYRENPAYRVTGWRRIWNTGMPQMLAGVGLVFSLESLVRWAFPSLF